MDKITQQRIKEAKQLLEQYAPKGEFLAYINEKEARILKAYGGAGIPIKQTNIPSFFPWVAAAIGISTLFSFMQSRATASNLKKAASYDKKIANAKARQQNIIAAKRAQLFASEALARQGQSGNVVGQGSNATILLTMKKNSDELKANINQGLLYDIGGIDNQLMGSLAQNSYSMYGGLLSGATSMYGAYQNYTLRKSLMSEKEKPTL